MSTVPPPPSADVASQPPPPKAHSITVGRVSRWFGDVVAVSDVSFQVSPGVTALLGPNGAGKSTMLRMLAGLMPASQGELRVLGANPRTDRTVRGKIGLVSQQEELFAEQTALEFVRLAAVLNGIDNPEEAARSSHAIVEMDHEEPRPIA